MARPDHHTDGLSRTVAQRIVFVVAPLLVPLNLLDALGTTKLVREYGAEVEGNPLLEPLVSSGGFVLWKVGVAALVAAALIAGTFHEKSRTGLIAAMTVGVVFLYSIVVMYILGLILFA